MSSQSRWLHWKPSRTPLEEGRAPEASPVPESPGSGVAPSGEHQPGNLATGGTASADVPQQKKPAKPAQRHIQAADSERPKGSEGFAGSCYERIGSADAPEVSTASAPAGPVPVPSWGRTVDANFGARPCETAKGSPSWEPDTAPLTVARHNLRGTNRFGQDGSEFPYCSVRFAAWRECLFDLRRVRWFRTADDAAGKRIAPPPPVEEPKRSRATFADGIKVEIQDIGPRVLMWVNGKQRTDFATLSVAHGQQTAEYWYGPPLSGWEDLGGVK